MSELYTALLAAKLAGGGDINEQLEAGTNIVIEETSDGKAKISASGEVSSEDTYAREEIQGILDGTTIDSFSDVETALEGKADTSDIPTVPITEIQKNGTKVDPVSGVVNITVPTSAADVSALPANTVYAGASTAGGSATSAAKLDTASAGSTTQPVYFANGVPTATGYSVAKNVPADAVFTDTTYSFADNYDASTNKGATVATVTNAVNALDVTGGSVAASKTISAWSETDGKVSVSTQDIAITGSQAVLTGYEKTTGNVAAADTVTAAIGKLETKADNNTTNILLCQSIVTGKNIFNKKTFIYDAERSASTGKIIANNLKFGVSTIIPVRSGKTIYFSNNSTAIAPTFMYTWDKSGEYIGRSSGLTVYTVPNNVGYISICLYYNDGLVNSYQVEYDEITPYSTFSYIYSNDLMQNLNSIASEILASVNMFGSIAGIGDSYTAGISANSGGTIQTMTEQSYIATMGKRSGVPWHNYGVSGATAKTYITNNSGLPAVLAATADDLYIINIGQNDINVGSTVGTIADIKEDYTQNPDTYYGNMGSIITQIKEHAPNAKIILVKSWLDTKKSGTDISYQSLDGAIAEIATHFHIPCIAPFEDLFFNSQNYKNYLVEGHPTPMGYAMMGIAMERLLSKCIVNNPSYFQFSTIG